MAVLTLQNPAVAPVDKGCQLFCQCGRDGNLNSSVVVGQIIDVGIDVVAIVQTRGYTNFALSAPVTIEELYLPPVACRGDVEAKRHAGLQSCFNKHVGVAGSVCTVANLPVDAPRAEVNVSAPQGLLKHGVVSHGNLCHHQILTLNDPAVTPVVKRSQLSDEFGSGGKLYAATMLI